MKKKGCRVSFVFSGRFLGCGRPCPPGQSAPGPNGRFFCLLHPKCHHRSLDGMILIIFSKNLGLKSAYIFPILRRVTICGQMSFLMEVSLNFVIFADSFLDKSPRKNENNSLLSIVTKFVGIRLWFTQQTKTLFRCWFNWPGCPHSQHLGKMGTRARSVWSLGGLHGGVGAFDRSHISDWQLPPSWMAEWPIHLVCVISNTNVSTKCVCVCADGVGGGLLLLLNIWNSHYLDSLLISQLLIRRHRH